MKQDESVMDHRIKVAGLQVARVLHDFIAGEALPGSGLTAAEFWAGFAVLIRELGPRNRELLRLRNEIDHAAAALRAEPPKTAMGAAPPAHALTAPPPASKP